MTSKTLLLRQVNPSWIQQGRVTSQLFRPTPKDNNLLSVYNGDLTTAEQAWQHFTDSLGYQSVGVMAVSVQECIFHELAARPDPHPFPAHAVIDFDEHPDGEIRRKAKHLKKAAEVRGWQYQITESG